MKTLIIYDLNGNMINQVTGFYQVPNGVPYIEITIPSGKRVIGVNVETQEPILEDIPPTEIELLQDKISILEEENERLKLVNDEQDNLLVDSAYKIALLELTTGIGGM